MAAATALVSVLSSSVWWSRTRMIWAERTFGATPGLGPTMSVKLPVVVVLVDGQANATPLEVTECGVVKPTTVPLPLSQTVLMLTVSELHHCVSVTDSVDWVKPE